MYRVIIALGLGLAACGPRVEVEAEGTEGSSGSSSSSTTHDAGMSSGVSSSSGAADGASSSSSGGETGPAEIVPPEWVTTVAPCNDDGTLDVFVEAVLSGEVEQCTPLPLVDSDVLLQIFIPSWNQSPGTFEVGPDAPAHATSGGEILTGTANLEVWAPGHPSRLTVDLTGPSLAFAGVLELETCTTELGSCTPPP